MGSEPPKYLVIHEIIFSRNKGVSQKNQNKNFVKKRITKYFGSSDPMNELLTHRI